MIHSYRITRVSPADCHKALQARLDVLKGIGPVRAAQLAAQGLATVGDLLYHLPFRYEDRRNVTRIIDAVTGETGTFVGRLKGLRAGRRRQGHGILTGTLTDGTGSVELVWFNSNNYVADGLRVGQPLSVYGRVVPKQGGGLSIPHPEFEALDENMERQPEVRPVYRKPGSVPQTKVRAWVKQALERFGDCLPSFLPPEIVERHGLVDLKRALETLHRPTPDRDNVPGPPGRGVLPEAPLDTAGLEDAQVVARRSLVFDELFYFQLALELRRRRRMDSHGFRFLPIAESLADQMRELLPYRPTKGQEQVLQEIYSDMEAPGPMCRLLYGDVGSGKTVIAWFSALRAIENGRQALLLAPTELLAEQHYERLQPYADRLGVRAALLSGSSPSTVRQEITRRIGRGAVDFVVGTHSLIQKGVTAPRMGLGIIDEQHRFGVNQRTAFIRLSSPARDGGSVAPQPDLLLMSATPIPRSFAMALSGDLEVSLLDEMPPGRPLVRTLVVREERRHEVYERVRVSVGAGRQAFLVCPLVEESNTLPQGAAETMARLLPENAMKGVRLGLVHGQMPSTERDEVMRRFRQGEIQVLVATTVIEVGLDVPGATLMVIEHAERFGLAQLHQLRGRIGRGRDESYCVLIHYGSQDDESYRRLKHLERARDGFTVAELDLRLRGAGELLGTLQAGNQGFRVAHLVQDHEVLQSARREAQDWLLRDPNLRSDVSRRMRKVLRERWNDGVHLEK